MIKIRKVHQRRVHARNSDNHKARRRLHKLYIREGYTAEVCSIDPKTGRKHWAYSYKVGLQLREAPISGFKSEVDAQ